MGSVARSGGNQFAVGCACVGGEEVQTDCEGYLFNSFGCKARENHSDKVRARGREDYVSMGGVGCFCAGRREGRGRAGWQNEESSVPESFEGDGQD